MFKYLLRSRSVQVMRQIKNLEDERDDLNDQLMSTRNKLAELEQKKKMEDENIRHMVRIKEESLQIQYEKNLIKFQGEKETAIAKVKDQYRDKVESDLNKQIDRMQKMYGQILERLPNYNVRDVKYSGSAPDVLIDKGGE